MIKIKKEGILLEKTDKGFENEAVMNPAVIREGDAIHLFYRAVRKGNYSSIGHCILKSPIEILQRKEKPILFPEEKYESQGIEDPRIVKIEDTYYLTYSVYDKVNVLAAYATSTDLKTFKKHPIITPKFTYREYKHFAECNNLKDKYLHHYKFLKLHGLGKELSEKLLVWDKNVMLFPKKIDGKFAMLHRIYPGIQIAFFEKFSDLTIEFWTDYMLNLDDHIVMDPKLPYESGHIGGGCPPIETKDGWLFIFHAVESTPDGSVYHASAALLDLDNPLKVLSRLHEPLISPTLEWEKKGIVNNVVFPTGAIVIDETLYIYYGAADTRIATASLNLNELLNQFKKPKNKEHVQHEYTN